MITEKNLKMANFLAKNSCDKWQKLRFVRKICRKAYRHLAESKLEPLHGASGDTYPYRNKNFANWPESDESGNYTLISDSSNFVIRYATSYCAHKIWELTGCRLRTPATCDHTVQPGQHPWDARFWQEYLAKNGFTIVDPYPLFTYPYVGISDRGEWGEVVWYEGNSHAKNALVSTYNDHEYVETIIDVRDYTWVRIEYPQSANLTFKPA